MVVAIRHLLAHCARVLDPGVSAMTNMPKPKITEPGDTYYVWRDMVLWSSIELWNGEHRPGALVGQGFTRDGALRSLRRAQRRRRWNEERKIKTHKEGLL